MIDLLVYCQGHQLTIVAALWPEREWTLHPELPPEIRQVIATAWQGYSPSTRGYWHAGIGTAGATWSSGRDLALALGLDPDAQPPAE